MKYIKIDINEETESFVNELEEYLNNNGIKYEINNDED